MGLEAQQAAIESHAQRRGAVIVERFVEIESGKRSDRPQLARALHLAQITGATLIIAKLDRLSRNAGFLLRLRDSGVRFLAADMPEANELTVGIMAVIAEEERKTISRRTREALQAARARGTVLGNPNGAAALHRSGRGNREALAVIRDQAQRHARSIAPVLSALRDEGVVSLGGIAAALNARGILTPRGGRWHKSTVRNLLCRLAP